MPNRSLTTKKRDVVVDLLIQRDGAMCRRCRAPIDQSYQANGHTIELDHINGNPKDYRADNLQLLCKSCNVSKRNSKTSTSSTWPLSTPEQPRSTPQKDAGTPSDIYMCVKTSEMDERARIKHEYDYEHGTPQMQVNQYAEIKFRRWLTEYIAEHGSITKKETLKSGSSVALVSPATIDRYLQPLTAEVGGIYDEIHMNYHKTVLVPRKSD